MSNVIDNEIVAIKLDNSNFEKNAKATLKTLSKLKNSFNFSKNTKSISALQRGVNNFNTDSIASNLDRLASRFSTWGIVSMSVINRVTNSFLDMANKVIKAMDKIKNQIISGGITRAMNIENAHFMLQGLLGEEEKVQEVMDKAMDSVDGTAYAYDEAAKAAASFTATGMTAEQLVSPLKAITGVAAMTNSEYENISQIFTTVAGNGRLMGEQLLQLSSRGLNAAATLSTYCEEVMSGSKEASSSVQQDIIAIAESIDDFSGFSEGAIREAVSEGLISFELFSAAMDDAFGEHAKKANETFTGAFSNIKAALSRIGADFISPLVVQNGTLVNLFNTIRVKVNEVRKQTQKLADIFVKDVTMASDALNAFVGGLDIETIFKPIIAWVIKLSDALVTFGKSLDLNSIKQTLGTIYGYFSQLLRIIGNVLKPIKTAFEEVFSAALQKDALTFSRAISSYLTMIEYSTRTTGDVFTRIWKGIFSAISIGIKVIKAIAIVLKPIGGLLVDIGERIVVLMSYLFPYITKLNETEEEHDRLGSSARALASVFEKVREVINIALDAIGDIFIKTFGIIKKVVDSIVNSTVGQAVISIFETIRDRIKAAIDGIGDAFSSASNIDTSPIDALGDKVKDKLQPVIDIFDKVKDKFDKFVKALQSLFALLKPLLENIWNSLKKAVEQFGESMKGFKDGFEIDGAAIAGKAAIVVGAIGLIVGIIKKLKDSFLKGSILKPFIDFLKSLTDQLKLTQKQIKTDMFASLAKSILMIAAALFILGSMPDDALLAATAAMTGFVAALFDLIKGVGDYLVAAEKLSALGNVFKGIAAMMVALTAAIAVVMYMVNEAEDINQTVGYIVFFISIFTLAMGALMECVAKISSTDVEIEGLAAVLLALAGAIVLIVDAIIKLGIAFAIFNKLGIASSLVAAFGVIIGILGVFLLIIITIFAFMNDTDEKKIQGLASTLLAIGVAIKMLVDGLVLLALAMNTLDDGGLMFAATILLIAAAVGVLFYGILKLTEVDSGKLKLVATAIFTIASAIAVLVGSVIALSTIDLTKLLIGIGAMAAILLVVVGVLKLIQMLHLEVTLMLIGGAVQMLGLGIAALGIGVLALVYAFKIFAETVQAIEDSELLVKIGEAFGLMLLGIISVLIGGLPGFILSLVGLVIMALQALDENVVPEFLIFLGNLILKGLDYLISIVDDILTVLFDLFIVIIDGVALLLGDPTAAERLRTAIGDLLLALLEFICNFFGIHSPSTVFAEIGGYLIQGFINGIVGMIQAAIEAIKSVGEAIWNWICNFFGIHSPSTVFASIGTNLIQGLINGIGSLIGNVVTLIGSLGKKIIGGIKSLPGKFLSFGKEMLGKLASGISNKISSVKTTITSVVTKVKTAFTDKLKDFKDIGKNIMDGLKNGVGDKIEEVKNKVGEAANGIKDKFKSLLGINSPSKVFAEYGKFIDQGLINGMQKLSNKVGTASESVGGAAMLAMNKSLAGVGTLLNDTDINPTITPLVDLTDVTNKAKALTNLFNGNDELAIAGKINKEMDVLWDKNQNGIIVNNNDVVDAISELKSDINTLSKSMSRMQVVMDTGRLVGELTDPIDQSLGKKFIFSGRGI